MGKKALMGVLALLAFSLVPRAALAFCGFYISGADGKLTNNATLVVLMRDGTRTVLSMQNNYQGPPQDFAMVVPVPVVLHKKDVKTLPREVFDRVEQLSSPRLVEYWEQDPCAPREVDMPSAAPVAMAAGADISASESAVKHHVKIEARFSVGEYDILILSAKDSMGLDAWLHEQNYKIPAGAEPLLRPYVQMGMKFFVAKVNIAKVHFADAPSNGSGPAAPRQAMLSPLRFHYDTRDFYLPIRLGLVNSGGAQDLIIHILAHNQRYEAANYDNVAIPTNITVKNQTRDRFGTFYAKLFDSTLAQHPRTVVTEYAWQANSCDPCPGPVLSEEDLASLGSDALKEAAQDPDLDEDEAPKNASDPMDFVLTRLHVRYDASSLGDDIFFKRATPIQGGREWGADGSPNLDMYAHPADQNNFQARYVIRHEWTGAIACDSPQRGIWGGPPNQGSMPIVKPALGLAFAARDADLADFVRGTLPPGYMMSKAGATPNLKLSHGGCAGCQVPAEGEPLAAGGVAILFAVGLLRRKKQ
jgi:hypothetical protein